MILTSLSVNGLLFCFLLFTYQWKKKIVHSHIQEMAHKRTWQFLLKLSASSLSLKSGLRTFLSEWRHSCWNILFVIHVYGDRIRNATYFIRKIISTAIRWGHPGQNKPCALEKVERLEKGERIRGITDPNIDNVGMDRCHWCQGSTQMIARVAWRFKHFF